MYLVPDLQTSPGLDVHRAAGILLRDYLSESRFNVRLDVGYWSAVGKRRLAIRLKYVRLRNRKHYCGQHPNECQIVPGFAKKHKNMALLEGADWVAWNDMLNDFCDQQAIIADIWSTSFEFKGRLYLRKGRCRRVRYPSVENSNGLRTFFHWDVADRPGCYEDWIGRRAERSEYPDGTPGIPEWRLSREADYKELLTTT